MAWCGLNWSGSGKGQVRSSCECGNEPSVSIKCWETIEWLHNWWPLRLVREPWLARDEQRGEQMFALSFGKARLWRANTKWM
jgi:hypothetical protein